MGQDANVATTLPARKDGPTGIQGLKADRDRFVAFAFCGGDVLLQLSPERMIRFAAGATAAFMNCEPDDLVDTPFLEHVEPRDRALVGELFLQMGERGRFEDAFFRLADPGKPDMSMAGYRLEELGGDVFLAIKPARGRPVEHPELGPFRDPETSLYSADSFSQVVQQRLNGRIQDSQLTIIELDGADGLRERIGDDGWSDLQHSISACLRAASIYGDTAAALGDDRFGVLHTPETDIGRLEQRIQTCSQEADPDGAGLTVEAAPIDMQDLGLDEAEAAKALVYTIQKLSDHTGGMTLSGISQGIVQELDLTTRQMSSAKLAVESQQFDIALQPILDLASSEVHHHEALVRLRDGSADDEAASPFDFIRFAEDVGLIAQFDFVMCREALRLNSQLHRRGAGMSLAVNLSGRSIATPSFIDRLHEMLNDQAEDPAASGENLMFEVTESYRIRDLNEGNAVIQALRQRGHKVCIDDFGAGEAAFEYLRAFEVDYVKIDGSYVENAQRDPRGEAILTNMARLCSDLGVETIAERIENESLIPFLQSCGVRFGQGFLFGKPILADEILKQLRDAAAPGEAPDTNTHLNLKRRGVVETWS